MASADPRASTFCSGSWADTTWCIAARSIACWTRRARAHGERRRRPEPSPYRRLMFEFRLDARDGAARAGTLTLPRGLVETPAFMPVGTHGVVRGLSPADV